MPSVRLLVPEPVADALRGEASRRLMRPGEVLADFVRAYWPSYVAGELARDLRPVLDAEAVYLPTHAESAPGCPKADPRPVIAKRQVTHSISPGDPDGGPGGGAR